MLIWLEVGFLNRTGSSQFKIDLRIFLIFAPWALMG